jgi:hypothetical protein
MEMAVLFLCQTVFLDEENLDFKGWPFLTLMHGAIGAIGVLTILDAV